MRIDFTNPYTDEGWGPWPLLGAILLGLALLYWSQPVARVIGENFIGGRRDDPALRPRKTAKDDRVFTWMARWLLIVPLALFMIGGSTLAVLGLLPAD